MQHKALGRVGQLRLDQIAPHADHLGGLIDQGPGAPIVVARLGVANLESDFLQDPKGAVHDSLDLLGGQDLQRRPGIAQAGDRRQRGTGGTCAHAPARVSWGPSARQD